MTAPSPSTSLHTPSIHAQQGLHFGRAIGFRLLLSVTRIAVRGSLGLSRAIVSACRPVTLPALPDSALMIQPGPHAVTIITCRPAYLPVHFVALPFEKHSNTGASKQCFTAGTQNQQRSVVR